MCPYPPVQIPCWTRSLWHHMNFQKVSGVMALVSFHKQKKLLGLSEHQLLFFRRVLHSYWAPLQSCSVISHTGMSSGQISLPGFKSGFRTLKWGEKKEKQNPAVAKFHYFNDLRHSRLWQEYCAVWSLWFTGGTRQDSEYFTIHLLISSSSFGFTVLLGISNNGSWLH